METRKEVADIIQLVKNGLTAAELLYVIEADLDNPNLFTIMANDEEGYVNSGLLGWSEDLQAVYYACYNPVQANHDQGEGVAESESRCWWSAGSVDVFLCFLKGEVREIEARFRQIVQESEKSP